MALAKADLAAAQLNLELCRIISPVAGTVTQFLARQGTFVERSTPLLTIADLSRLFVQVRVPSLHTAQLSLGTRSKYSSLRILTRFSWTVARLSGQADPATGDVDAFVLVNEQQLRPGLACRGRLWFPELPGVWSYPQQPSRIMPAPPWSP